jgi:alanine racemase
LSAFENFLQEEGITHYPVHIEIETGMNRLGFSIDQLEDLANRLNNSKSFTVQSVFTHLAASEDPGEDEFSLQQFKKFEEAANFLKSRLNYDFLRHISNSAAVVRHPQMQMDMVRLGIGLYGVDSSGTHKLNLEPVATLKSTVAQIKHLKAGESVSYNRKTIVGLDSVIATVRMGYADGFPRRLGNGIGRVWIRGLLVPVIGTVCMDMFMVDITGIDGVEEGDEVIIFGRELPVDQLARDAGTIPYEIMTGVSQRVKRVYFAE